MKNLLLLSLSISSSSWPSVVMFLPASGCTVTFSAPLFEADQAKSNGALMSFISVNVGGGLGVAKI